MATEDSQAPPLVDDVRTRNSVQFQWRQIAVNPELHRLRLAKRLDRGMRRHLGGQCGGDLERAKRKRVANAHHPRLGRIGIGQRRQHGADRLGVGRKIHRQLGALDSTRREHVGAERGGVHPGKPMPMALPCVSGVRPRTKIRQMNGLANASPGMRL